MDIFLTGLNWFLAGVVFSAGMLACIVVFVAVSDWYENDRRKKFDRMVDELMARMHLKPRKK